MTEEQRQKGILKRTEINIQHCSYCQKECKNKNALSGHEHRCKENPNKLDMSKPRKHSIKSSNGNNICRFCNDSFFKKHINKHEIWCDKNPNLDFVKSYFLSGKIKPNQFIKAKMLGEDVPEFSQETRQKISENSKSIRWTDEQKANHSISMKKAVLDNPDSYSKSNRGRVKHIKKYDMIFDGSWELKFYEWCLNNNIKAIDNKEFYEYKWNGNLHLYNPDYYLPDLDIFVEVKGYYDDRDLCKWTDFNYPIFILDQKYIKLIEQNTFNISNIIENKKDFI